MVCSRGESLTRHKNQMKLLNAIVSAVVIGSAVPLISSAPAVAGCYEAVAASDYGDMLRAGTSPSKAMGVVKSDYYDGTESCRIKFNMEFWKDHRIKPFNTVNQPPSSKATNVADKGLGNTGCWNRIIVHLPAGDVKECI